MTDSKLLGTHPHGVLTSTVPRRNLYIQVYRGGVNLNLQDASPCE